MSSFELSWASLPSLPLERVCAFVPLVDLVQLSRVNRHYHDVLEGALGMREIGEAMFDCPDAPLVGAAKIDVPRAARYFLTRGDDKDDHLMLRALLMTIRYNSLDTMEALGPHIPHTAKIKRAASFQAGFEGSADAKEWLWGQDLLNLVDWLTGVISPPGATLIRKVKR